MRLLALLALLLFCIVYTQDTRLYPGNGDQLSFLHAAETFRAGQGFFEYDGRPLTLWPPGYSMALAVFGGGLQAARIINALSLWLTLILGYIALRQYDTPRSIAAGVGLAFIAYVTDHEITFQSAHSESFFMPLLMLWFVTLAHVDNPRIAWGNAALGAMMALTRYVAIPFALLGLLWIAYRRGVRGAIGPAFITVTPIALWMLRNYLLIGRFTGHYMAGNYGVNDLWKLFLTLDRWMALVIVGGVLCVCLAVCFSWRASRTMVSSTSAD